MRLLRLGLLLFHMYTKDRSRRDLEHIRHDCMVLEGVIKDTSSLGGVFFLVLLKKGKALGRRGQFCGPRLSCMAGVNNMLPFITMGSSMDHGMLEGDRIPLSTEGKSILVNRLVRGAAIGK